MGHSKRLKQSDGNVYIISNSTDNEYCGKDETLNATNKVLLKPRLLIGCAAMKGSNLKLLQHNTHRIQVYPSLALCAYWHDEKGRVPPYWVKLYTCQMICVLSMHM